MPQRQIGASCGVRAQAESPQGPEADVDAAAKERPEEAPFAALRPHGCRPRTWSRRPAAKPTRPNKKAPQLDNFYDIIVICK